MSLTSLKKALLLFVAVFGLAIAAQAQQPKPAPSAQPKPAHAAHAKPTPEQRVDKMAQDLGLTPTQKAQFLQLERDHQAKMGASRDDQHAARDAHRKAQRALLTPGQAAKFDAMPQKRHGKGQGKGRGHGKSQ